MTIAVPNKSSQRARTPWLAQWNEKTVVQDNIEALALINCCRQRNIIMLDALAKQRVSDGDRRARRMSRLYIQSYSARLNALARAYVRKVGPLQDAEDDDLRDLVLAAGEISAWDGSDEKAVAFQKTKRGDDFRWVHKHGMFQYALELLSVDAASVLVDLLPTQFLSNGGVNKLKLWLGESLPGTALVLTVDIPRCFDTVRRKSLVDSLRLPERVVRKVLFNPMDRAIYLHPGLRGLVPKPGPIAKVSSARRGIPQGSALSQLASDVVVAKVMRHVSENCPGVRVASHGDNLIFLLEDASCKSSVISALTSAVAEYFGKDVSVELTCRIQCSSPAAGFTFCRRHYVYKKNLLQCRLPEQWVNDFAHRTMMRIEGAHRMKQTEKWDSIDRSIRGWLRDSPKSEAVVNEALDLLLHLTKMRGGSRVP